MKNSVPKPIALSPTFTAGAGSTIEPKFTDDVQKEKPTIEETAAKIEAKTKEISNVRETSTFKSWISSYQNLSGESKLIARQQANQTVAAIEGGGEGDLELWKAIQSEIN